ncbi:hypothetical protein K438DRAFT_1935700 [Mycena galopus ATCC 62051]|nr:hypothetical protein K438DRAFT_1935700 [Mycena galopus ATCC 62051]
MSLKNVERRRALKTAMVDSLGKDTGIPLDQNHHHQPAWQGSPAPIVGAICLRPPDATVGSDSDEGSRTPEVTKSPNTRCVMQHRKTQPGQPELEPLRYDTNIDSNMLASTAPAPSAAAAGSSARPPEHVPLLAALESLLARAVATTTVPLLAALESLLARAVATTTALQLEAAAPLTTPVDSRSTTPPRVPRITCLPHRTIYRWLGAPPLSAERPPEVDIVRVLERSISDGNTASRIQGVSWTPAGHLAIHTRAPFLATQLAPFFHRFDDVLKGNFRSFGGFGQKCILDVDTPWTWVVLHGVPAKAFWGVMDSEGQEIWTELTSQGYDKEVLMYHPMVKTGRSRDDEDHLSVKFAFTEEGSAKCLLAQRGLFLFGARCRATKYRL